VRREALPDSDVIHAHLTLALAYAERGERGAAWWHLRVASKKLDRSRCLP
jgi:hypothetical protein